MLRSWLAGAVGQRCFSVLATRPGAGEWTAPSEDCVRQWQCRVCRYQVRQHVLLGGQLDRAVGRTTTAVGLPAGSCLGTVCSFLLQGSVDRGPCGSDQVSVRDSRTRSHLPTSAVLPRYSHDTGTDCPFDDRARPCGPTWCLCRLLGSAASALCVGGGAGEGGVAGGGWCFLGDLEAQVGVAVGAH